jgi:hypothetical protein
MFSITGTDDVADLIRWSTAFFERFGLAVDLPGGLRPGPAESLAQATADGFTDAIALPSATWQHQHLDRLATAMAGGDDRSTPDVAVEGVVAVGRPAGPYILLLRPDPTDDDDLRGLTAPGLRRLLGDDACLTVGEYLVIQRAMFDRHGDHRFDDYTGDPPGWMWLADSRVGERTAMAYWYGPKRRVEIAACATGSKNRRKGARRCRVIPLS